MLPTLSECNLLSGFAWTGSGAGGHGAGRGGAMVSYLCVQWQWGPVAKLSPLQHSPAAGHEDQLRHPPTHPLLTAHKQFSWETLRFKYRVVICKNTLAYRILHFVLSHHWLTLLNHRCVCPPKVPYCTANKQDNCRALRNWKQDTIS